MSKRFKHSEEEAAENWNTDTRTNERIDCLKGIGEHKTMSYPIIPYEDRDWYNLPYRVRQKLRRLYDNITQDEEIEKIW